MVDFQSLLSYTLLSLVGTACAGIGPVTDLTITNAQISPDGYVRDAVVTNKVFPAPLITGKKVSSVDAWVQRLTFRLLQGDRFMIDVINNLTNHTMLKTTSIVGAPSHATTTSY